MPTTKTCMCTLEHAEELPKLGNAHLFKFRFRLVPVEKIDEPDEDMFAVRSSMEVKISESLVFTCNYQPGDLERVAYWCAVKDGIKTGKRDDTLEYNTYSLGPHPCDPGRIDYPPRRPFEVEISSRIGF